MQLRLISSLQITSTCSKTESTFGLLILFSSKGCSLTSIQLYTFSLCHFVISAIIYRAVYFSF